MATLRVIRRRIRSTKNTQQITRAMKMIAASKLRKAQGGLSKMRPYAESLGRVVRRLLEEATSDEHPLLQEREVKTTAAVLFTGDRGLCGAYNGTLIRETRAFFQESAERNPKLIAIGKKGADFFRRKSHNILEAHTHVAEEMTLRRAGTLSQKLIDYYLSGTVDEVVLIYSSFESTLRHPIVRHRFLPMDVEAMPTAEVQDDANPVFLYEPSHEEACRAAFGSHLAAILYLAFLESMSSEFASRMTAMDAATQNADEMIHRLTMEYNRARQSAITREILDIVGGAEALQ